MFLTGTGASTTFFNDQSRDLEKDVSLFLLSCDFLNVGVGGESVVTIIDGIFLILYRIFR